jgi:hypothetical protein
MPRNQNPWAVKDASGRLLMHTIRARREQAVRACVERGTVDTVREIRARWRALYAQGWRVGRLDLDARTTGRR